MIAVRPPRASMVFAWNMRGPGPVNTIDPQTPSEGIPCLHHPFPSSPSCVTS